MPSATAAAVACWHGRPAVHTAQIAARIAQNEVTAVIFLVDPLYAHPHEPDIQGLLRVCNVHNVPLATNLATAELLLAGIVAQKA